MTDRQQIFISYRRADTAFHADILYDKLASVFGEAKIFKDVDSFQPGDDFPAKLAQCIENSEIVLALIGSKWLTAEDQFGRRIHNPRDWVRIEIASALELKKRVVPILFDDAEMPSVEDLPDVLQPLADRHAFPVGGHRANRELDRLIVKIKDLVEDLEQERISAEKHAKDEAVRLSVEREAREQHDKLKAAEKAKAAAAKEANARQAHEQEERLKVEEQRRAREKNMRAQEASKAEAARHSKDTKTRSLEERLMTQQPEEIRKRTQPVEKQPFVPTTSWSKSGRSKRDSTPFWGLLFATVLFVVFMFGIALPYL